MADSIREKILQNVETTILGITEEDGFEVTIRKVVRIPSALFDIVEFPFVSIVDATEEKQEGVPVQKTTCLLHLELVFWNQQWTDMSQVTNQILAAIEKAMGADPTRGGYAYDTDVVSNQLFLADESMPNGGGSIQLDILYRHKLGDPYTA